MTYNNSRDSGKEWDKWSRTSRRKRSISHKIPKLLLRVIPTVKHYPDIASDIFWHTIWKYILWHIDFDILSGRYFDILSAILSCIYSDVLSGISSDILSDILSGILSGISSEILCGWGPVGNTLIRSSRVRSGGEHFDPELAVRARRGPLRSSACSWGLAGNALILGLLFGPGGEHCYLALAVEVWRGTFWSWACCSGLAGNTAI